MEYREQLKAIKRQMVKIQRQLEKQPYSSQEDLKNGFAVMSTYKDTLESLYGNYTIERCFEDLEECLEEEIRICKQDIEYLIKCCISELTCKIDSLKPCWIYPLLAEFIANNRD